MTVPLLSSTTALHGALVLDVHGQRDGATDVGAHGQRRQAHAHPAPLVALAAALHVERDGLAAVEHPSELGLVELVVLGLDVLEERAAHHLGRGRSSRVGQDAAIAIDHQDGAWQRGEQSRDFFRRQTCLRSRAEGLRRPEMKPNGLRSRASHPQRQSYHGPSVGHVFALTSQAVCVAMW
jgi:hypothetical protein